MLLVGTSLHCCCVQMIVEQRDANEITAPSVKI